MNDNFQPTENQHTNTHFLEERTVHDERSQQDTPLELPQSVSNEISERSWMTKELIEKPILLKTFDWKTSNSRGELLWSCDFPEVIIGLDSVFQTALSIHSFFKIAPIFRVQLNSTTFHQGQLICSWDPFHQSTDDISANPGLAAALFNIFYATGLPNGKIMASESDPIDLKLPFIQPRNFLTTNSDTGFDIMGRLRVNVLNPLVVGANGSSTISVSVWLTSLNTDIRVPMNPHALKAPSFRVNATSTGLLTDLTGNKATGNFGQLLKTGVGLASSLTGLNLDDPTQPLDPPNTIMPIENPSTVKGVSRALRLSLDPKSGQLLPDDILGNPLNDMDLLRIMKTPMLCSQIKWSDTDAPGTALFTNIPLSPMLTGPVPQPAGYPIVPKYSTFLSYGTSFFGYWRGALTFDIEIVATQFHSGKLIFAFKPNVDSSAITFEQASRSLPNAILDLQTTSKLSFSIPFVSATGYKAVRNPKGYTENNDAIDECVIGYMACFVQNRLIHSPTSASSIEINIYIRAGEDYHVAVPRYPSIRLRQNGPAPTKINATSTSSIELQVDRSSDQAKPTVVLSSGQGTTSPIPRFGETFSMLDILRRYTSFDMPNRENIDYFDKYNILVHPLTGNIHDMTVTYAPGFLALFSALYSGWTGSLRYKFIFPKPRTSEVMATVTHNFDYAFRPTPAVAPTINEYANPGYAYHITTLSQHNALEVEVPFFSPYNFLLIRPDYDDTPAYGLQYIHNGILSLQSSNNSEQTESTEKFGQFVSLIAAGEDFRFIYLRAPPIDNSEENSFFFFPSTVDL
jgi:hypothetical protein